MDLSDARHRRRRGDRADPARGPVDSILVLTSFATRRGSSRPSRPGADGYLLKHGEPEVILDGIREVLRGGSPLDPSAARVAALQSPAPRPSQRASPTAKTEVLSLVTQGLPNKCIARRLGISERTVKAHLTHIFQRVGVTDRTQAALWATRRSSERGREY